MSTRSYEQYCGLARALDVVGDRWMLLIVRELLIGARRYSDLRGALTGIASNLLADRLRDLQREGVISMRVVPEPTPARLYQLTALGRDLEPAVLALTRWGGHRMPAGRGDDAFRPDWLVIAIRALLAGRTTARDCGVRFLVEDTSIFVAVGTRGIRVDLDSASPTDLEVVADGETALAIVSGLLPLERAIRSRRCVVTGKKTAIRSAAILFADHRAAL